MSRIAPDGGIDPRRWCDICQMHGLLRSATCDVCGRPLVLRTPPQAASAPAKEPT